MLVKRKTLYEKLVFCLYDYDLSPLSCRLHGLLVVAQP